MDWKGILERIIWCQRNTVLNIIAKIELPVHAQMAYVRKELAVRMVGGEGYLRNVVSGSHLVLVIRVSS